MTTRFQMPIRIGLIAGFLFIFLTLIGFTTTSAELLNSFTGNITKLFGRSIPMGDQASHIAVIVIAGLVIGYITTLQDRTSPIRDLALSSAVTGGVAGALASIVMAAFAMSAILKVDLREYLYQLSPPIVQLLTISLPPLAVASAYLGIFLSGSVAGSMLTHWYQGYLHSALSQGLSRIVNTAWQPIAEARKTTTLRFVLNGILIAGLLLLPQITDDYVNRTLGTVGIYVLIGLGLNIVVGLAGLLDLGYVAFFAVGAYTVALMTAPVPHHLNFDFWMVLPLAIIIAAVTGVLLGVPVLRLRGDYLAIVTLGFGEIIKVLVKSDALTGFFNGAKGIPKVGFPILFGQPLNSVTSFLYIILIGIGIAIFATIRLEHSKVGRAWVAIREDETVAQAMGINTLFYKLLAFGIGAAFAGLGGVLFASRNQFTGPDDFTLLVSINVLSLVIVGGMGSIPGVIAGAFILKGLPEVLRDLDNYRILAFGILLVVMMILRPQGIFPSMRRKMEIHIAEDDEPLQEGVSK